MKSQRERVTLQMPASLKSRPRLCATVDAVWLALAIQMRIDALRALGARP